jgi:hypothetical protein
MSEMFKFDFIKKAMNCRDFVETISVIERTLQTDPGRIIFRSHDCWVRLRLCVFMVRNRARLSILVVEHYRLLTVPPDWRT